VANGVEAEPASLKDRTLLRSLPHLVLDGGILAAQAVGADELILCLCESSGDSVDSIAEAIEERRQLPGSPRLHLSTLPERYVAGEESALVNHLNDGSAIPTFVHGLDAFARTVEEIAGGVPEGEASRRMARLASLVRGRGACHHPNGTVHFILSALETFAAELADHARHGRCDGCMRPAELPLPVRGGTASALPETALIS
jgi:NADH:ubiquinone oxidoreductase subunit F (NADH-binding)